MLQRLAFIFFLVIVEINIVALHTGFCQKPTLAFKHFTVEDGLSHSFVREIHQDSRGFLWLATEGGINKFDGNEFSYYKYDPTNPHGVSHNNVTGITEGPNGDIWFTTWGGGVSILDVQQDRFFKFKLTDSDVDEVGANIVFSSCFDSEGRMWACTFNGLFLIDPINHKVLKHYVHHAGEANSLSSNRVRLAIEDSKGNLWVASLDGGLDYFNVADETFHHQPLDHDGEPVSVVSLCFDDQQRLWVGTWGQGAFMIDSARNIKTYNHNPREDNSLLDDQVWTIALDGERRVWLGTDVGLSIYNEAEDNFYNYKSNPYDPKSMKGTSIKNIYADKEGRMWVGTLDGGLSLFDTSFIDFEHYYNLPNESSLNNNNVTAVLELENGGLLVGTDGGGLNLFDRESKTFRSFTYDVDKPTGIGSNKIKALCEDSKGRIWIGHWAGGLDLFDPNTFEFTHFRYEEGNKLTPNNDNIVVLEEDGKGNIWLGTFGGGVNKFNPETGIFEYFIPSRKPGSISYENIRVLDYYKGKIYLGAENGYLDVVNADDGQLVAGYSLKTKTGDHIAPVCMRRDAQGYLWVGTLGEGLWKLDEQNGGFETFIMGEGSLSNYIYSLEIAGDGTFWMGTNLGICSFSPSTGETNNYGVDRGVQGTQFSRLASATLSGGEMFFGGDNGFNIFRPEEIDPIKDTSPLVFTRFEVFNKLVDVSKDSPLKQNLQEVEKITLTHEKSLFSLTYASLNYSAPKSVKYCYRMLGFVDESWQYVGQERKATYSNLPPKTYTFEVGVYEDENNVLASKKMIIEILPPWWGTIWFRLLVVLLVTGGAIGYYFVRVNLLRKRNKELEHIVKNRTYELSEKNSEIAAQNEELHTQQEELSLQNEELTATLDQLKKAQSQLVQSEKMASLGLLTAGIAHEINNPVNFIKSGITGLQFIIEQFVELSQLYAQVTTENVGEKLVEIETMKKKLKFDELMTKGLKITTHITTGANRTAEIVKGLRSFSRSDTNKFAPFNIVEGIENTLLLLNQLIKNKVEIHKDYDNTIEIECVPGQINQILMNLLTNALQAIKEEGEIFINAFIDHNTLCLKIRDTGEGIPKKNLPNIFDPFFTTKDVGQGTGLGLSIVMGIIEGHQGRIEVESHLGEGTTFVVSLPLVQHKLAKQVG
ncbi:two-component regulator propeller domain-containing protein [Flammeovirgaceae bacterium SG7u.111]|nr:two-component regulator propeller domain-containing protein [Flammeovirgaceae bacterium SG7u.132]WPO36838.1 two-component regulator propeller domain-containing protein [Flammeovirgaceae bacterium SG7u.111]